MLTINELAIRFDSSERPAGNILDIQGILAQAIAATIFYSGYAVLSTNFDQQIARLPLLEKTIIGTVAWQVITAPTAYPAITSLTNLSVSEWAIIRPLFLLYVERENAIQLEASRGMGVDVFGRSSSEVAGDITQMELTMPHNASLSLAFSI